MENLESVLLSYKNKNRIDYQYCAEFLRLIGIYVCENMKNETEYGMDVDRDKTDFSISFDVDIDVDNSTDSIGENNRLGYLKDKINSYCGLVYCGEWYDKIAGIYDKYRLLQASVTLQYFRMNAPEVLEAGKCFEKAADELVNLTKNNSDYVSNRHIRYAKLFCKQKANLAHFLCNQSVVYFVNDLAAEGLSLLRAFPDFSNAWALLGFVYQISKNYTRDAIDAFQRAIDMIGNQPYISSIYYWLGRKCEEYPSLKGLQDRSYLEANKLMPKYRNVYKISKMYYDKKDWEVALLHFRDCIERLERRGTFFDPLEQEYYFKVNSHISDIYLKLEDYRNTIFSAEKAIQFKKNIEDGKDTPNEYTKFYFKMYVNDTPQNYIELALSRMRTKRVYQHLATAYQKIGMQERAEYYWQRVREEAEMPQ